MKLNTQPPEKVLKSDGTILDYVGCFNTIQGEGPFAGRPATFIRLAGCTMQCPTCDTDYTSLRRMIKTKDLVQEVLNLASSSSVPLFVITGGEPLRQNLNLLISQLYTAVHCQIQIETSGTAHQENWFRMYDNLAIVCSPKAGQVAPPMLNMRNLFYKYPLRAGYIDPEDGLPTDILGTGVRPARPPKGFNPAAVYVLPEDSSFRPFFSDPNENLRACAESAMRFGYTVQVQLHKFCKLP